MKKFMMNCKLITKVPGRVSVICVKPDHKFAKKDLDYTFPSSYKYNEKLRENQYTFINDPFLPNGDRAHTAFNER